MKFIKSILLFSALCLFSAACSGTNSVTNTTTKTSTSTASVADDLTSAREIYSKRCVNCHKENGEGGEKEFDNVRVKIPNFKAADVSAESDEEYIEQIERGGHGMPAFKGKITDDEIKNLVRLIRRDFQGK